MNLKEWCLKYIELYKINKLKQSTVESYYFSCKLIPSELSLNVTELELQELVNDLHVRGKAASTISHTFTIIRQALRKAYQLRLVDSVPMFDAVEFPRSDKKKVEAFTQRETEKLVTELLRPGRFNDVFLFILVTGVRVGEALALKPSDIDWKDKSINIERTNYRGLIQEPKTANGKRCIPITAEARCTLRRALRKTAGNDVIFNFSYSTLRDAFKRVCLRAGVTPKGIHALRHTYATAALRSGVNVKTLSALLGHSSTTITMDVYCTVELIDKQKEADKISFFMLTSQPSGKGDSQNSKSFNRRFAELRTLTGTLL